MANLYTPTSASKGTDVDSLSGAPDAHAASHATGGSDPITADDIGALAVTELNKPVHGLNMDGEVISGLAEPSADDHAATKLYVDTAIAGVGSGASHTSGTLAARPASPAAGDTYAVTSGVATGDRYACYVTGAWTLTAHARTRSDETPYHWWRLRDASGGAVDSGSGATDLAEVGTGGWRYAAQTPLGDGVEVSGSAGSRYLRGAVGAGVTLTTAATLAAWVRPTDVSGTRSILALETNQSTNGQPYASIAVSISGTTLRGWVTTTASSGSGQSTTGGTIVLRTLHLVGVTWSSGTLTLWVDGVAVATLAATGTTLYTAGSSQRWTIGELVGPGERSAGTLADARVYDTAKDSTWWRETYARGAGLYEGQ